MPCPIPDQKNPGMLLRAPRILDPGRTVGAESRTRFAPQPHFLLSRCRATRNRRSDGRRESKDRPQAKGGRTAGALGDVFENPTPKQPHACPDLRGPPPRDDFVRRKDARPQRAAGRFLRRAFSSRLPRSRGFFVARLSLTHCCQMGYTIS